MYDACAADLGSKAIFTTPVRWIWGVHNSPESGAANVVRRSGALTSSPEITNWRLVDCYTGAMVVQQVLRQTISVTKKDSRSVAGNWQGLVLELPSLVASAEAEAGGFLFSLVRYFESL